MSTLFEPATCSPRAPTLLSSATIAEELVGALPGLKVTSREDYPYQIRTNSCGILRVCPCDGAIRTRFDCDSVVPDEGRFNHETRQWVFENLRSMADLARAARSIKCVVGDVRRLKLDARMQGFIDAEDREIATREREREARRVQISRLFQASKEGDPHAKRELDRLWWNLF